MDWFTRLFWPRAAISAMERDVSRLVWAATETNTRLSRLEKIMAADRDLLAALAADLTALAGPIQGVFDALASANARIADLEGQAAADEAADLEAIAPVKDAFDAIAAKFRSEPEVPDVEPLPEPEVPVEDDAADEQ